MIKGRKRIYITERTGDTGLLWLATDFKGKHGHRYFRRKCIDCDEGIMTTCGRVPIHQGRCTSCKCSRNMKGKLGVKR